MYDPEKYAAVADNFVYVHRALRRDLARIIEGGRELFESDFPRFARILAKHTELEDVLFFPALEERVGAGRHSPGTSDTCLLDNTTGNDEP